MDKIFFLGFEKKAGNKRLARNMLIGAGVGGVGSYLVDKKFIEPNLTAEQRKRREEALITNPAIGGALVGALTGAGVTYL